MAFSKDPETDPAAARRMHTSVVVGVVYGEAIRQKVGDIFKGTDIFQSAMIYADELLERMAPRDPAEEMLVMQMVLAHGRALHLSHMAVRQTTLDGIRVLNGHADRASNTYRRLMQGLSDYRRPSPTVRSITAIQQANIAEQQVVLNGTQEGSVSRPEDTRGSKQAGKRERQIGAAAV